MPRLPTPGGDSGNWGEILNEYLGVSLSANGELKPDSITQDHLQTDSVGRDQLAADSVTTYNLADATVTDDKLATAAVTTPAIANESVTSAKLAPNTLTKSAVGLSDVDNTSDVNKPLSTATQTALDTKLTAPTGSVSDNALVRFDGTTGKLVQGSGVTVDDSGNLGVGISSPLAKIDITDAMNATLRTTTTDTDGVGEWASYEGAVFKGGFTSFGSTYSTEKWRNAVMLTAATNDSGSIIFRTRTANTYHERLFVSNNGLIGLNTSSPTHTLTLPNTATGISLYNTADQTTNYERLRMYWSGGISYIINENAGTGAQRAMRLGYTSSTYYQIDTISSVKHTIAATSGSTTAVIADITSTGMAASSGIQVGLRVSPAMVQSGSAGYTALLVNPTESTLGSGAKILADFQVGGSSKFSVTSTGNIVTSGTINGRDITADGTKLDALSSSGTPQVSTAGTTFTIPVTEGASRITLSANATASFAATPASTTTFVRTLILIQAASDGPYTLTLPTIEWASDANAPTMPTVANAEMIVHLCWTGAAWRGMFGGYFYP